MPNKIISDPSVVRLDAGEPDQPPCSFLDSEFPKVGGPQGEIRIPFKVPYMKEAGADNACVHNAVVSVPTAASVIDHCPCRSCTAGEGSVSLRPPLDLTLCS